MLTLQQLEKEHLRLVDKIRVVSQNESNPRSQAELANLRLALQLIQDAEKAIQQIAQLTKTRENLNMQFSRLKFLQKETQESAEKNKLIVKKLNMKLKANEADKNQLVENQETITRLTQEANEWRQQNRDISSSITEISAEIDGLKQQMFAAQADLTELGDKIQKMIL
ncbi:MAG: hypothetical protein A3F18_02105 [Legionellales bacterium RIFCSPHIGHO2_12_FULL_37_14]|nr:MAG: hypothetical protein A3F18_02105 [Legionellales bacterium RIFCSPHIGHO2_12_FULL_37_14]